MSDEKNRQDDPLLEAMEDMAASVERRNAALDSRVGQVEQGQKALDKTLQDKLDKSMEFVATKFEQLEKRQLTYGRITSAPLDDLLSTIPDERRGIIAQTKAQLRRNVNPLTGAMEKDSSPLMSSPVGAAVATLWFEAAMKAQLPGKYGRNREKHIADLERYEEALGQVFGKAELSEGADASGGYLVPDIIGSEILRIALDAGVAFGRARHVPMSSNRLELPNETTGCTVNFVAEGGTMTEGGPVFGVNLLDAKKIVGRATASIEVLEDSVVSLVPYLTMIFGEKIARTMDQEAFEGVGTNFTGVDAATGVNTVGSTTTGAAISYSVLVQTMFKAGEQSTRTGAAWFMNPAMMGAIAGLTDSNGQPIFQYANVQGNVYPTILGKPVYLTNVLSVAGTASAGETDNLGTVYFGDPMTLIFGDRSGMRFDVSEHVNWATGKIDMRLILREGFTVATPAAWTRAYNYVKIGG